MGTTYTPIACSLHDHIEAAIVLRKSGTIIYSKDGDQHTFEGKPTDWITRNSEEFLLLENGKEIRGDRIISFLGIDFTEGGTCGV